METPDLLLQPHDVLARLGDPVQVVVDCRFDLGNPAAGEDAWLAAHIPGAAYAHTDRDLSGPLGPALGRHPLPDPAVLALTLGRLGIGPGTHVVAYDASGGPYAARLWWLLCWMRAEAIGIQTSLLDGGWQAWTAAGGPVRGGSEVARPAVFTGTPRPEMGVTSDEVLAVRCLVDAREAMRFRGEKEPIDPVAGRIPGAVNQPWKDNLGADGRFLPPDVLRTRYLALLGGVGADAAACYCGSGITASHTVFAMTLAGLPTPKLYAGSWSEWIRDPTRPIATG